MFKDRLVSCQICKKKYLKEGIKNHIIGSAKNEVWRSHISESKLMPHEKYYIKNFRYIKVKKLII